MNAHQKSIDEFIKNTIKDLSDKEIVSCLRGLFPKQYQKIIKSRLTNLYKNISDISICIKFGAKSYCFIHDIDKFEKCEICKNKDVNFNINKFEFSKYCSYCASHLSKERLNAIENTCIKKHGAISHFSNGTLIREKIKDTVKNKYGVDNVFQIPLIKKKCNTSNSFKFKDYQFPSGRIEKIQGYENFAIDILLKNGIDEMDILTSKECPYVKYGINRLYFPDLFIKSQNKLIEVKSRYTYEVNLNNTIDKQISSKSSGYNHEIWILDKCGNILEIKGF